MANIYKWLAAYTPTKEKNPIEDRLSASLGYLLESSAPFKKRFLKYVLGGGITPPQVRNAVIVMHPYYRLNIEGNGTASIPDLLLVKDDPNDGFVLFIENKWDAPVSENQLRRYRTLLEENFGELPRRELILLCREIKGTACKSIKRLCRVVRWDDLFDNVLTVCRTDTEVQPFYDYCREELVMGSFAGIPLFSPQNPYTIEKAKNVLKSIDKNPEILKLKKGLGLYTVREPKSEWMAWGQRDDRNATQQLHLTIFLNAREFGVSVTVPDAFRRRRSVQRGLNELIMNTSRRRGLTKELINKRKQLGPMGEYWVHIIFRHAWGGQSLTTDAKIDYKVEMLPVKGTPFGLENERFRPAAALENVLQQGFSARENNVEIQFVARYYINPLSAEAKNRTSLASRDIILNTPDFLRTIIKAIRLQESLLKYLTAFVD
jgi:hypothetical protein